MRLLGTAAPSGFMHAIGFVVVMRSMWGFGESQGICASIDICISQAGG